MYKMTNEDRQTHIYIENKSYKLKSVYLQCGLYCLLGGVRYSFNNGEPFCIPQA